MALYHKWGVKTGFIFALQFFMHISDSVGCVKKLDELKLSVDNHNPETLQV